MMMKKESRKRGRINRPGIMRISNSIGRDSGIPRAFLGSVFIISLVSETGLVFAGFAAHFAVGRDGVAGLVSLAGGCCSLAASLD